MAGGGGRPDLEGRKSEPLPPCLVACCMTHLPGFFQTTHRGRLIRPTKREAERIRLPPPPPAHEGFPSGTRLPAENNTTEESAIRLYILLISGLHVPCLPSRPTMGAFWSALGRRNFRGTDGHTCLVRQSDDQSSEVKEDTPRQGGAMVATALFCFLFRGCLSAALSPFFGGGFPY